MQSQTADIAKFLATLHPYDSMSEDARRALADGLVALELSKGQEVYAAGETVHAEFRSGNPSARLSAPGSYVHVEQQTGDGWTVVADDADWETRITWQDRARKGWSRGSVGTCRQPRSEPPIASVMRACSQTVMGRYRRFQLFPVSFRLSSQ